jgi:hypothetical protein
MSRHYFLILLAILGVPVASALEKNPPLTVETSVQMRIHKSASDLPQLCRTDHLVYACSDFVREALEGRCERFGDGWGVVAKIRLEILVHLSDFDQLSHERAHIRDIKASLQRRLEPFLSARFDDQRHCAAIARVLSEPGFVVALMNELRFASNEKFGCTAIGRGKRKIRQALRR